MCFAPALATSSISGSSCPKSSFIPGMMGSILIEHGILACVSILIASNRLSGDGADGSRRFAISVLSVVMVMLTLHLACLMTSMSLVTKSDFVTKRTLNPFPVSSRNVSLVRFIDASMGTYGSELLAIAIGIFLSSLRISLPSLLSRLSFGLQLKAFGMYDVM